MRSLLVFSCLLMTIPAAAGDLTARFDLTLNRVLSGGPPHYTDDLILADAVPRHVRRFTEFSGDVSGRYIEALSVASQSTGRSFPSLDRIVAAALRLQKPDGHWGDPFSKEGVKNSDMALLWGNGRMLVGLLAYNRLKPDPEVLAAASRLGDCLVKLAPRLNRDEVQKEFSDERIAVGYICWTQTIEGLAELARATGKAEYRALAEEIAARTERYPAQHSHGLICALRGILGLHNLTGEARYLEQVEREYQGIGDSKNVLLQGGLPEAFHPRVARDEGCSEADWLRLNLDLWKLTEKSEYLDQAEHTLFNEFYFNQFDTGDFGHHVLTKTGVTGPAARAWWCCTLHGLRAFPEVLGAAFAAGDGKLVYSLPVDGEGKIEGLHVRAHSRLESDSEATLEIVSSDGKERTIEVRLPPWASEVRTRLHDVSGDAIPDSERSTSTRVWKTGERVAIDYVLKTRSVANAEKKVSFYRGPWLLAVDNVRSPAYFDEPHSQNRIVTPEATTGSETLVVFAPAEESRPFGVADARCLLEYLPGGYSLQPGKALLRPIAEKTGGDSLATWEFIFTPKTP